MKIVLFSRYPRDFTKPKGGVESVTVILAKALAAIPENEIHLIALEKSIDCEQTEKDGDVTIHRLPASVWPQILDIHCGPGRKRLLAKIRELSADIVHSHETFGLTMGNLFIPHVFTVHGFDHANIPAEGRRAAKVRSILWKFVEKRGLAEQKTIISISPYVNSMIESLTKAPIHNIDNPVDDRYFSVNSNKDKGRVLCVGWVNERKNTLGSVEAFARAIKNGSQGKLVIAGEAKEKSYLDKIQAVISKHGIHEHVEFLGHINRIQLEQELAKASILLLPSLQENAPMAISEAMAASIPVVASNLCGMPYMVEEGKSGFLVDPQNTEQIGEKVSLLLGSAILRDKMGKRGREIALDRFHPEIVAQKTIAVYKQAITNRNDNLQTLRHALNG